MHYSPIAVARIAPGFLVAILTTIVTPATAEQSPAAPLPGVSAAWWSAFQHDIASVEYQIGWHDRTPLAAWPAAFGATNRAQSFRMYFASDGIRVIPRPARPDQSPTWVWGLNLSGWGYTGNIQPADHAVMSAHGNRVEYARRGLVEWYVNDIRGIEQGFTIHEAPPRDRHAGHSTSRFRRPADTEALPPPIPAKAHGGARAARHLVRIELTVAGDLTAMPAAEPTAVDFIAPGGAVAIHFGELHVLDATGVELPAWFEAEPGCLSIVLDDAGAAYPIVVDPLATSPSFSAESDQSNALFGISAAAAGDVNGDGYGDVIVGAYLYDNGQNDEGRAYVYHGSAAGLASVPAWTAEGDQASALFGWSVATAGDVNGDGYGDVVVGARGFDNGQSDEGRAFVFHGSAAGLAAAPAWTAESDQNAARFGVSVAAAGDVNGDGYGDVIVGADNYDGGEAGEGRAYLFLGSAAGLAAAPAWTGESDQASAGYGFSVAWAGDVNADGFSDVVIGAPTFDNGQSDEGRAFVYHGSAAGLAAAPAWTAESDQASAWFGASVATAGDVNGDGFSDVIVGAYQFDNGQSDEGRAFVYHGSAAGLAAAPAWTAESDQASAWFGASVATAGDVNGDGYADVVVGATLYSNGQANEGRAFVYRGSAAGLSAAPHWTAESNQAAALFGASVATAGDVNGDGLSDVIVGAYFFDNGQSDEGGAFAYLGSAAGLATAPAWTAESDQASAILGFSAAAAGDVNGDGYGDVIVGAPFFDNGLTNEGRAYVFHGSAAGLSAAPDWTAESDQFNVFFGHSVASAGDVNGDGYSDVIVGAPQFIVAAAAVGRAFVYYGSPGGLSAAPDWTADGAVLSSFGFSVASAGDVNGDGFSDAIVGADTFDNGQNNEGGAFVYHGSPSGLSAAPAWSAESNQEGALFGFSVAGAGDVNGDGYSDVIVGARSYDNPEFGEGVAFVYHGSATGLTAAADWTAEGDEINAYLGWSVAGAGDVNGDGYSDVIVGAPTQAGGGQAFVFHGSAAGLAAVPVWTVTDVESIDHLGASVAGAGDVNGDGYGDVIVGENDGSIGFENTEGLAYVYHGSAAGPATAPAWIGQINQTGAHFGYSVASAGDVNGDGYGDVIVGATEYDGGQSDEGRAFLYEGNDGGGRASLPRQMRTDGGTPIDRLGRSDSTTSFRICAIMLSVFGRARLSMQHEVKPLGALFDGTGLVEDGYLDTGGDGAVEFNRLVSGLSLDNVHHWRVRARYDTASTPFQHFGPWFTIPANGWNEADLRTSCSDIPGDMNCDCSFNVDDIPALVLALIDPDAYATAYPACDLFNGDMQPDGAVDGDDVQLFVDLLLAP